MSDAINIKQIQSVADLKNGLQRFGSEAQQSLDHAENILRKVLDKLQYKLISDQREMERCTDNVRYARDALEDCEAQEDEDYTPDCTNEYDELDWTRRERSEAEQGLNETRKWRSRVKKQIDAYRSMAARLKKLAIFRGGQAKAMLQSKITDVERYMAISAHSGQVAQSYAEFQDHGLIAGHEGGSATVLAGGGADKPDLRHSGTNTGWVELGIRDVEVQKLSDVEGISDKSDFKKVLMKDMKAGLIRYLEIRKVLDTGKGNSKDHWAEVDRKKDLSYPDGYQRIYEAFYGREPIRITKDGNKYTVENGRHRVWLAQQMGIRVLPASIVERKKA